MNDYYKRRVKGRDPAACGSSAIRRAELFIVLFLLVAGLAVSTRHAVAAQADQTFGPGKVNCQALTGTQVDCLLTANRVTRDDRNVATFSIAALPLGEQARFRMWCLPVGSECTVTVTGRRTSAQAARLDSVTSLHWTRPSPPVNEAAARARSPQLPSAVSAP